jgi:hypothetical protein
MPVNQRPSPAERVARSLKGSGISSTVSVSMGVPAHRMPRLVLVSLTLLTTSCSAMGPDGPADTTPALFPNCEGPATALDPAIAATLPAADEGSTNTNLKWAALAERVPGGFAGAHRDNGIPVLLLVDVSQAAAAKAALADVFDERFFDVAAAEVRAARWDYDQLMDWWHYLVLRRGFLPGGSSGAIWVDVPRNRIHYSVEDARQRDRLLRELSTVDLPCGLVYIEVAGVVRDS